MKGRKPVRPALAALHGHPSKTPPKKGVPEPVGDLPTTAVEREPAPLELSDSQREIWDYALTHAPPGLLKKIDRMQLLVWVIAADLHASAYRAQSKLGLLVRSPKQDLPMQSPYLAIINRQAFILMKAAAELGFTPVSRPRIFAAAAPGGEAMVGEGMNGSNKTDAGGDSLDSWFAAAPVTAAH